MKIEEIAASDLLTGLRLARVNPSETLAAVEALAARPDVLYAEPNYAREPFASPNDPLYPNLWALKNTGVIFGNAGFFLPGSDIDAEEAWNITTGSRSVVVGIVDGGIDLNHPDLQPNMWVNPAEIPGNGQDDDGNGVVDDINGFDFFHNQGSFFDFDNLDAENHATHVAGIVGAVGDNGTGVVGVSWQVSLMSLKIFGRNGESPFPSNVNVLVRAYTYAKKMRDLWISSNGTKGANIRILNNSIGGYGRSQTEFDAVSALNDSGVLFVAAAGNHTRNNDVFPIYPAGYELPNVISVAASTQHSDALASFTNVGARTVTMSAPGQTIQSTLVFGNYDISAGTSMASPYVAGAGALICAEYPNITVDKLRAALIYNGDRVSSHDYKTLTGRRLNAAKSLNAVAENDVTPPAPIADFRIIARDGRRITLAWTAPGDNGNLGTVSLYDIRFSASDLSSTQQFEGATSISPLAIPIPSSAGTLESAVVEVPFGHTSGKIGLRATDNMGNTSPIAVVSVSLEANISGLYNVTQSQPEPLSTGGTRVERLGPADDGLLIDHALPFAFPYFGSWVRNITLSTNGAIYFSTPPKYLLPPMTGNGFSLDSFSSIRGLQTNAMIAGMWDDLVVKAGVFSVTPDANRIIFRWEAVTFDTEFDDGTSRGENPIKFEIELRKDGTILLRYGEGNQKLFPVVGISGGTPDAYVISSHTSEIVFKNLTNANTVKFVPQFTPAAPSTDLQIGLNDVSIVTPRDAGGSIYSWFPQAAVPGQTLQLSAIVTDLGPDPADNVVITAQLPPQLSFVECGLNVECIGPPAGTSGGTVTVNAGTLGRTFFTRVSASIFSVRVNAPAGTTLNTVFSVTSSTPDPNPANNTVVQTILVADYGLFSGVVAVAGGGNTNALRQDGTVWSWGLPIGSIDCEGCGDTLPKRVLGLTDVVAIAAGWRHALALKSDGTVWSWGLNEFGQLGNQPLYINPFHAFPPTRIPGLTNIKSIATALNSSFALAGDGSVWAWGDNSSGQIGDGTNTLRTSPVRVTTINGVRSLATNGVCTYAIKQDGSVWSWGSNAFGLLGTGSPDPPFSAVPIKVTALTNIETIVLGDTHVVALRNDGTVMAFGNGGSGQLGNGTNNSSSVPIQVPGLTNVTQVAANALGSMALKADGTVWAWGEDQLSPKRIENLPSVTRIAAWWTVRAAILTDNTLQMWGGLDTHGALGDGTLIPRNVPGAVRTFNVVTAPTVTPGGRGFVFPTSVIIDCDTFGAVIHYTTTGAEPTENDPVISAGTAFRVDRTMVLKVKAWKPGLTPSQTISATYTVLASDPPVIFVEQSNSNLAVALDSVTLTRGPFRILSEHNFSADHHTRVILFTSNLGLNQSDAGLISVQAAGFNLTVENVGELAGVPGLDASFVIVRLPDGLPPGELALTITVRGLISRNSPVLTISP